MKKIILISTVFLLLFVLSGIAQKDSRIRNFWDDQYKQISETITPYTQATDAPPPPTVLIFSENFDAAPALPAGWTKGGNSGSCQWNVDASPAAPGFFSSPYSLNYNNGTNFNCGWNYGWVRTPMINTSGTPLYVSFWFNVNNECSNGACPWDVTYLIIRDDLMNVLANYLIPGNPSWNQVNIQYLNPTQVEQVYLEFYFDTYDGILNSFYGPFIDNLELREEPVIPVSNWALVIGIALIATFVIIRYRR